MTEETNAAGNRVLTIKSAADPQFTTLLPSQPRQANIVGQNVTIRVHAPTILKTNGEVTAQDKAGATAQWQMSMSEALAQLNRLAFTIEYALTAPTTLPTTTPDKAPPVATPKAVSNSAGSTTSNSTLTTVSDAAEAGLDSDGDWVTDDDETAAGSNPTAVDSDGDGLSDFEELQIFHSDPTNAEIDTDGDGFADQLEQKLFSSDPAKADADEDGDFVPDSVEPDLRLDPTTADSDSDGLSDLLEVYWLISDPTVADPDEDGDGFPDPLESWLPSVLADATCHVDLTLQLDAVLVNDPEEADTTSITGGDETFILYIAGASQDGEFYGSTEDNQSGDPNYVGAFMQWQGEAFGGSRFTGFQALGPLSAPCGYTGYYGVRMIEDDSPFGGQTDMGLLVDGAPLLLQRIPIGWGMSKQGIYHFEGTGIDGSFDYELHYTWQVGGLAQSAAPQNDDDTQQASGALLAGPLAVERTSGDLDSALVDLLPEAYLSANQRIAFRYQSAWQIEEPRAGYIPVNYTIVPVEATGNSQATTPKITIYDPVHLIEMIAVENYEELSDAELLQAFVKKGINNSATVQKRHLREIQLGEKTVTLWQPPATAAADLAGAWVAFRALDNNLNLIHFAMDAASFAEQQKLWLTFTQMVDYQAPSRRLDDMEKTLRKYIAATATGDLETMKTTLCRRNREINEFAGGIFGSIFGLDPDATAGAMMNFTSGMTELDTSKLFFETQQVSAGSAEVMVSGVVSLNADNGRQTLPFRQFNMIGRNLYRMQEEDGQWLLCD